MVGLVSCRWVELAVRSVSDSVKLMRVPFPPLSLSLQNENGRLNKH